MASPALYDGASFEASALREDAAAREPLHDARVDVLHRLMQLIARGPGRRLEAPHAAVTHDLFNLHASVMIGAQDDAGCQRLCRYL